MAGTLSDGPLTWSLQRDAEGYRTYKLRLQVISNDPRDGPATILQNTAGLPQEGDSWVIDNDLDYWAWCRSEVTVTPRLSNEPNHVWELEYTFSNKPPTNKNSNPGGAGGQRCNQTQTEDPLLEPPRISGGFTRYQEEATYDVYGKPVVNSAWEAIRGPQVEFDHNRPSVKIVLNLPGLNLPLLASMVDTVNAYTLWGLPPRTIKLSNAPWEQKFYGKCYAYYTVTLEFDVSYDTWDKLVVDEGTKVLSGHWSDTTGLWVLDDIGGEVPDYKNPTHFIHAIDRQGNPIKAILDGRGQPFVPELNALITDCDKCPGGTPQFWKFSTDPFTNPITLGWQVGCQYYGSVTLPTSFTTFTLEVDPNFTYFINDAEHEVWKLTMVKTITSGPGIGGVITTEWVLDTTVWRCLGPNDMSRIGGNVGLAGTGSEIITLTAGSQPGANTIRKYRETDFLLLGIPVTF